MLLVACSAMPLPSARAAWARPVPETLGVAGVTLGLGLIGSASALAASAARRRPEAIGVTWWVLAVQVLGVVVPDWLGLVLMPAGLVAGGFLFLWLTGHIHT